MTTPETPDCNYGPHQSIKNFMTKKQLFKRLEDTPDDAIIISSINAEGDGYNVIGEAIDLMYKIENGEIELKDEEDIIADDPKYAKKFKKCLVLYPY